MSRRLKQAAVVFVVVLAAAQLVRPGRTNPPIDPSRTIQAHVAATRELALVVDRSCRDCHTNNTVWRWYTQMAPLSWLMARGVAEGRKAGPETMLSPHDIETICTAARHAEANAADGGR